MIWNKWHPCLIQGGQHAPELSSLNPMQRGQHVPECQKNQPTLVLCFYSVLGGQHAPVYPINPGRTYINTNLAGTNGYR